MLVTAFHLAWLTILPLSWLAGTGIGPPLQDNAEFRKVGRIIKFMTQSS